MEVRKHMARIAREIWARGLSDAVGGNISVRCGNPVYLTPGYLGSRLRWRLAPHHVIVVDAQTGEPLSGPVPPSREAGMHLEIYRAFPEAGAVIHARPQQWGDLPEQRTGERMGGIIETLDQIAQDRGVTPAQVALRWVLQRVGVAAPVRNYRGRVVAAISVSLAKSRLEHEPLSAAARQVVASTQAVSRGMGWSEPISSESVPPLLDLNTRALLGPRDLLY